MVYNSEMEEGQNLQSGQNLQVEGDGNERIVEQGNKPYFFYYPPKTLHFNNGHIYSIVL
jgi:hypothetical protein